MNNTSTSKTNHADLIVLGGGLAGLVSAIDLRRRGYSVLLFEKKKYPFHRVCGEYISNEVKPYLERLGIFPHELAPTDIRNFSISSTEGKLAQCQMSMGGFGISRFSFDNYLYQKALSLGVEIYCGTVVKDVTFIDNQFEVYTSNKQMFRSRVVIGAFGKRSVLDKNLQRGFMKHRSEYIGIKHHFSGDFPSDLVSLHNFKGGYCGLSKVEDDKINLCFLTKTEVFKKYSSIQDFEHRHLSQNPHLRTFLQTANSLFDPLVISQVYFNSKSLVEDHILMCGDAAGLIHPLCGNGMAIAIHSAAICARHADDFLKGETNRNAMETNYIREWKAQFSGRMKFGHYAQKLLENNRVSDLAIGVGSGHNSLLRTIVKWSHGQKIY